MLYTVKIYGWSNVCSGHKVEILDEEGAVAHEFISPSELDAEISANQWIDDVNVSPIRIYTRGSSVE